MSVPVKTGVLIGVACVVWTFVMGFSGWYKDPALLNLFWVVVAIEVGLLVWGLRQTAAANTYWPQVGAGTLAAVVAAAFIFCGSMVFTSLVFPQYFDELRTLQAEMLKAKGQTDDQIAAVQALAAPFQTPLINALTGVVGTIVTGFVASLVIAAFCRKK